VLATLLKPAALPNLPTAAPGAINPTALPAPCAIKSTQ